jgi:hypothetical protein
MKQQTTYLAALVLVITIQITHAATIAFDDVPQSAHVGEHYAPLGVHFGLTDFGVQEGLANGDSGSWGLNGTVGAFFDGFNGGSPSTYSMTLTFDAPVTLFSLDASRSDGSNPSDTLTVSGFLGATLVDTRTITFSTINSWTVLSLAGTFDTVKWSGNGSGFHPYGIDNITFSVVPEPSTFSLLIGAGIMLLRRRRGQTVENGIL